MKNTNKIEHTPTPWRVTHQVYTDGTNDIVVDGKVIAHLGGCLAGDSEHEANAAFIVRAVNSHEAMLGALKRVLVGQKFGDVTLTDGVAAEIRRVIEQAEGY